MKISPRVLPSINDTPAEILQALDLDKMLTKSLKEVSLTTGFFNFSGLIFISKGKFSISIPQTNMSVLYSYIVDAGTWFGGLSLMPLPFPFLLIEEIDETELFYLSKEQVINLADKNPMIYKWIIKMASENIPQWFQVPVNTFSTKHVRVLFYLVTLMPLNVQDKTAIELNITQQELSNICGLSRPRVNEVLQKLEESKMLELKPKKIIILDYQSLFSALDQTNLSFYDPRLLRQSHSSNATNLAHPTTAHK